MTREQILGLPQPIKWAAQVVWPTGAHRPQPAPGALVGQEFVACGRCGGVESAATRHGDVIRCAEGHVAGAAS